MSTDKPTRADWDAQAAKEVTSTIPIVFSTLNDPVRAGLVASFASPGANVTGLLIERDKVAAVVEVLAGPHRLVSLMTAEAVDELGLAVGDEAVCVVKATHVIVEIPR